MSSRRSKRVKVSATPQDDSDLEYEVEGPARTKAKPAPRRRGQRGTQGSLVDMPKMPLDIIYEVS